MTAGSFGLRVSKSSTTRGRPPVMSLVLVVSRGIFARMSPGCTSSPSLTIKWARDGIRYFFTALFVNDGDQAGTVHGNGSAAAALNVLEVHELHDTVVANFQSGTFANARRGSTDVEGTHRKLRAGFADGLRGDDADRFAEFDHAARREVAAIA